MSFRRTSVFLVALLGLFVTSCGSATSLAGSSVSSTTLGVRSSVSTRPKSHKTSSNVSSSSTTKASPVSSPSTSAAATIPTSAAATIPTSAAATIPTSAATAASNGKTTFIAEPQDGLGPWSSLISSASVSIFVNEYLFTDQTLASALISAARRGILVEVIVAGNPYKDSAAPGNAMALFSGSPVKIKVAPARFSGSYSFDHAKYMVVDPGRASQRAIFGSPNATYSAMGTYNLEDAVDTTSPLLVSSLYKIFESDWNGVTAGNSVRSALVVSPGASAAISSILSSPGPLAIMAEELGSASALYSLISAHSSSARVLLPDNLSYSELQYANAMLQGGVAVRILKSPYVHAKLIINANETFIGSQNFSSVSLDNNREVGVILSDPAIRSAALGWFNTEWNLATPLGQTASSFTSTPTTTTTSTIPVTATQSVSGTGVSIPYLSDGISESQVLALWGSPTSTGSDVYNSIPELIWIYSFGKVYFQNGQVVYVTRS
ncbi:phospholipase D-like domain-containing protein [Acidithrix sp. C25]|uniref:phospholipase D-like domain-containing protein n=1 Tax=Acidithrix sp. C25 TaxID=1671482 RepID=UPI00191B91E2|nr:phospholipase D-like domain-containing protein [Acidithrix sp. C25]